MSQYLKAMEPFENLAGEVCDHYCRFLKEGPFHDDNFLDTYPLQCDDCALIKIINLYQNAIKARSPEES